jgi:hypothetical protein
MSFHAASAIDRVSEAGFRACIPDGWQQGRGAFGGLVIGMLTRAIVAVEPDPARCLRTLTAEVFAPVTPGDVEIGVEIMRRGTNLTNVHARLKREGAALATASAALGTPRSTGKSAAWVPAHPDAIEWTTLAPLPVEPPLGPVFARHYEYRSGGPLPLSGGAEPRTDGFVREKGRSAALDAAALIALLDAFWPALYSIETLPRAIATISFTAELSVDPSTLRGDEPLRHRARLASVQGGFMTEFRELWSGEQLVAMNQQTMALLG